MKELLLVRIQPFTRGVRLKLAMLAMLVAWTAVLAQEPTITPNYRDSDIRQINEAVGEVTGNYIIVFFAFQGLYLALSENEVFLS